MTAAAIAGVLIAGTAAVAANIGILNAADSSEIGELAATDELLPNAAPTGAVEAESAPSSTTSTTLPPSGTQQYDIAGTGSVWVMSTTSGLALDHVAAETGWTPVLSQGDLRSLRVGFTNGDRTIVFTAAVGDDGAVVVDVAEPTTVIVATPPPTPSPVSPTPTSYDDDHDDEYDEYDEYDDDEYEGADDDD